LEKPEASSKVPFALLLRPQKKEDRRRRRKGREWPNCPRHFNTQSPGANCDLPDQKPTGDS